VTEKRSEVVKPLRVHEVVTEKRSDARRAPYAPRKNQPMMKASDDLPFRPKFRMTYKELLGMPGMTEKLRFPLKSNKNLGLCKEAWCKFHKGFGHDMEHCITLGY